MYHRVWTEETLALERERRVKIQEEKLTILEENTPEQISGELDLQSLVSKVIEGKVDDWRRKPLKMKKVEL